MDAEINAAFEREWSRIARDKGLSEMSTEIIKPYAALFYVAGCQRGIAQVVDKGIEAGLFPAGFGEQVHAISDRRIRSPST